MKAVEEAVKGEDYIKRRVPFEWMAVYDALQTDDRKAISFAELEALCLKQVSNVLFFHVGRAVP